MSHTASGGQASDQANKVRQAGAGNPADKSSGRHAERGQIMVESHRAAGTNPGSTPTRSATATLTDHDFGHDHPPWIR
jgi:hypothetical protein